MRIRLTGLGFATLLAAATAAHGQTLIVGSNVNLSKLSGYQAETAIAINPTNPQSMFAWSNNITTGSVNFAAVTANGGTSWTGRLTGGADGLPNLGGDPTCTYDSFGNLFVGSFNSSFTQCVIGRSTNGGTSFTVVTNLTIADQPTIKAGPSNVAGQQSVWVS